MEYYNPVRQLLGHINSEQQDFNRNRLLGYIKAIDERHWAAMFRKWETISSLGLWADNDIEQQHTPFLPLFELMTNAYRNDVTRGASSALSSYMDVNLEQQLL